MDSEDLGTLYEEVGERFGIEFDYYLGEVGTVGELYHYILWKLGLEKRDTACLCPPTFFALREQLATTFSLDPKSISLDTPLRQLIPWRGRRRIWRKLEESMDLEFPSLCDAPGAVVWVAFICIAIAFPLQVLLIGAYITYFGDASRLLWVVMIAIVALTFGPVAALVSRFARPFRFRLPPGIRTVGQLVECLVSINAVKLRQRFHPETTRSGYKPTSNSVARSGCAHTSAFLRIRKALIEVTDPYPTPIQPETSLAHVLDEYPRRSTWRALRRNLGWTIPNLRRSGLVVGLCVAGYFPVAWLLYAEYKNLWLTVFAAIPYGILMGIGTKPLAVHLPIRCETVGGLAKAVTSLNYGRIATEYRTANAKEVWNILSDLMVELFDLPKEDVKPDMSLADSV
ncbi:MAG: hypothetical protein AMXMBFR82_01860 [Candidatus Hydrogenedentota bacterium]